ncbi:DUF3107 domain-containing protein [Brachybacterium huguangmaarense]|uniref:DUF3107 domain-containing protein n=1 Tax=Brachybacterium huguangmaarense TaxID=1652028 RepID=A0ABY6G1E5_9MICO|nr:DUF3107 domain-containing protein [Brachybacterium huguangmaarense]UYG16794.1 DUF3107 domain-containing protein [Brachybacterium huguangmaarense]
MEIRLGIQHSPREIVVETEDSAESITASIADAVGQKSTLQLTDSKGRIVVVPGDKIAYAELSTEEPRRVGFLG